MLNDQDPPSLKDRRMAARLTFFYKVVKGLVLQISPDAFLKPQRLKCQIYVFMVATIQLPHYTICITIFDSR